MKLITLVVTTSIFLLVFTNSTLSQPTDEKLQREISEALKITKERPSDIKALIELGRLYHEVVRLKMWQVEPDALEKGERILEKALASSPEHPVALAWYGSLLTLKGREAWFPWLKIWYTNKGIQKLDEAVRIGAKGGLEDEIWTRMIRANNSFALPPMFKRLHLTIQDLEYLLSLHKKHPGLLSRQLLGQIYLLLGKAYKERYAIERAISHWKRVLEISPGSPEANEAKVLISDFQE